MQYIKTLASDNGLAVTENNQTIIRYEAGEPINGQVYLIEKIHTQSG